VFGYQMNGSFALDGAVVWAILVILPRLASERGIFMQNTINDYSQKNYQTPVLMIQPHLLKLLRYWVFLITPILILILWHWVTHQGWVKSFLLPPPQVVFERFQAILTDGKTGFMDSTLIKHTAVTLREVVIGLSIGTVIGGVLGYWIAKIPLLEMLLSPVIVLFQAMPIISYAPLLVIWFGSGEESKIITCILIVFFPILLNTITGVRNIPKPLRDLMHVSNATGWQTFIKLEIPASLPMFLTGFKTGATLSVIGAVVGEFIASNAGLGFLLNAARQRYDTPLVFVSAIMLTFLAGTLYVLVTLLERRLLSWQREK
jgi:NitT/TauT family transport system permease protein